MSALERVASPRSLALLALVTVPALLAVNLLDLPFSIPRMQALSGGETILDMQGHYSAERAYQLLAAYGAEGRKVYLAGLLTFDVVAPPLMALVLSVAITLGQRGSARLGPGWLARLPFLAMALDYAENAAIATLLVSYPQRHEVVATLAGFLTPAKMLAYGLSALTAGAVWAGRARGRYWT